MSTNLWAAMGLVAAGGAAGSVARLLVAVALTPHVPPVIGPSGWTPLPLATLLVNTIGCFAIGIAGWWLVNAAETEKEHLRLLIVTGALGGFTTFSAFGWETLALAQTGRWGMAAANVAANNILGIGACAAGWALAHAVSSAPAP